MLKLFNSLGNRLEEFQPVNPEVVNIFTCGPSVYQPAHVGNFRTFLFEDVLVRYLEYLGYKVSRGMNFTDIEDKALQEAFARKTKLRDLTSQNIDQFLSEMHILRIKLPDYMPRASDNVHNAEMIIEKLLEQGIAYPYKTNIYFDPLKFPGFGKIYGLDMTGWPVKKTRFHQDTYPGLRWNRGDFILWHGCREMDRLCWGASFGCGWPAWNIQDPSMIIRYFDETLSIYCGGIDNRIRHHDYSVAILESIRPYPMAKYWLHGHHLFIDGKKMSKSKGNILYTGTLLETGFSPEEIRFFLIYGHYRRRKNYAAANMEKSVKKLRDFKSHVALITDKAGGTIASAGIPGDRIREIFTENMDLDLDVKGAFDGISDFIRRLSSSDLSAPEAASIIKELARCDTVLQVIF
jgi:cysteinyl-tRNA synthetase